MSKLIDLEGLNVFKEELFKAIYPVGSIYMSMDSTAPGTLFGGTWEQLKDKFLLGAGDTYSVGDTGGNASTTLTVENLPAHTHIISATGTIEESGSLSMSGTAESAGSHSHTFSNGEAAEAGSHNHTFSDGAAASAGAHGHTFTGTAVDTDSKLGKHKHSIDHGHGNNFSIDEAGRHAHQQNTCSTASSGSYAMEYAGSGGGATISITGVPTTGTSTGYSRQRVWTDHVDAHTHSISGGVTDYSGDSGDSPSLSHTHSVTAAGTISNTDGAHTHTVTGTIKSNGAHTHTVTGTIESNGAHTHTVSISGANHTHDISIEASAENTGSGTAFSNMPPYLTVYMWKRTA